MKITPEDVLHVADLARLDLDAGAVETFADQIGDILNYMDSLDEVDTAGVKPTFHAVALTNAFREDVPWDHLDPAEAMANAPAAEDGAFLAPRVVESQ
ncbi:MAG: Asp-tRNA(Asn)/Glu-tRNA(Gln) amidotransferase subunit GatC [Thermodesulfobacteriota bacterium]